jgi:hypothetical protein
MLANLGEVVDFVYNNGIWAPYELDPMEKDRFVVEALHQVESLPQRLEVLDDIRLENRTVE